jgi:TetR/AcrR family transcriptional regulator, regulator of cefoperazone and chloramphenicol sensitivity
MQSPDPVAPAVLRYRPGTHPKGEDTLRRILDVAIEVFAEDGYDGASTRALAERAKVNLPAIQYYFGSKEGLYRAAIDHIAKFVDRGMAPLAAKAAEILARAAAPQELRDALLALLDGFIELVTCNDAPPSAAMMIARAEVENAAALEPLQARVMALVFQPAIALMARLLGRAETDDEVKIRAVSIFGQALMFKAKGVKPGGCGCPVLGWEEIDEARLRQLKTLLREQTTAILRAATDPK